ncbi:MAG: hypothetical protein COV67_03865 [Nitrospinae bacterium CG11_big_fil_rev_8_21_14_0_20_56_8]|nr:MAG: hypothetical protein COV67_03865 [Nitrospinae bacterium CG11_big_fil_rev_8_21_14_0_20_56_8]
MAFIPGGEYIMGSQKSLLELNPTDIFNTDRHTLGPEDPAHMVDLDPYYIDVYETTNEQYLEYVNVMKGRNPPYMDNADFNQPRQPVVGVTWSDARKYCEWRGKRLPTEAEWEKAARGKRPIAFPWGDEMPEDTRANFDEHLGKTAPVGSFEAGKSDYGVYDLSGNVAEWVQDWHFPEYYLYSPKKNPAGPEKGQYKVIRGGNWRNNGEDIRLTYRNATVPSIRINTLGFRCAKSAAP